LQDLGTVKLGEKSAMKENIAGNVDKVTKHLNQMSFYNHLSPPEVEILAS
jgi:hypothetical protein